MKQLVKLATLATIAIFASNLQAQSAWAGDAEAGAKAWKKYGCAGCHSLKEGKKMVGPSLYGVIGRTAGTSEGFKYNADMKAAGDAGLVWNEETIAAFITADGKNTPKKYIASVIGKDKANIRMNIRKIKKQEDIDNIVAYIAASSQ